MTREAIACISSCAVLARRFTNIIFGAFPGVLLKVLVEGGRRIEAALIGDIENVDGLVVALFYMSQHFFHTIPVDEIIEMFVCALVDNLAHLLGVQTGFGGKVCQFPVKVDGVLHWNCLDNKEGVKVCNTQDPESADKIQTFDNLDKFGACEKCTRCIEFGTGYSGFALNNNNNTNAYEYVETSDDCQQICQSAEGCNFFNYDNRQCRLKYGVGKKCDTCDNHYFGPKYCPGKYISN